jgi:hypothetical protein
MSLMPLEFKARLIYYKMNIILGVISYPNVHNIASVLLITLGANAIGLQDSICLQVSRTVFS